MTVSANSSVLHQAPNFHFRPGHLTQKSSYSFVKRRELPFLSHPLRSMSIFSALPLRDNQRSFFESQSLILDPKTGAQNRIIANCNEEQNRSGSAMALLYINVGEPVHEDAHLAATFELLLKMNFSSLLIIPIDFLNRWTLKIKNPDMSKDALEHLAWVMGNTWLSRYAIFFAESNLPYHIIRWKNLISDSDFVAWSQLIMQELKTDKAYSQVFNTGINKYIARVKKNGELKMDELEARNTCLEYLIESATASLILQNWLIKSGIMDKTNVRTTFTSFTSRSDNVVGPGSGIRLLDALTRSESIVELYPGPKSKVITASLKKFYPMWKELNYLRINFKSQSDPQPYPQHRP